MDGVCVCVCFYIFRENEKGVCFVGFNLGFLWKREGVWSFWKYRRVLNNSSEEGVLFCLDLFQG